MKFRQNKILTYYFIFCFLFGAFFIPVMILYLFIPQYPAYCFVIGIVIGFITLYLMREKEKKLNKSEKKTLKDLESGNGLFSGIFEKEKEKKK